MVYVPRHLSPDSRERLLNEVESELQRREERSAAHECMLREREKRIHEAEMRAKRREEGEVHVANPEPQRETKNTRGRKVVRFAPFPTMGEAPALPDDPSPSAASQSQLPQRSRAVTRLPSPAAEPPVEPRRETGVVVQTRNKGQTQLNAHGKKRTCARSAFSFFMAESSGRYVAEARAQGMKLARGATARIAAEEWGQLEDKSRWEAMAEADKARFQQAPPPADEKPLPAPVCGAKRRLFLD